MYLILYRYIFFRGAFKKQKRKEEGIELQSAPRRRFCGHWRVVVVLAC